MSGLERFQRVGIDQHISGEETKGGELQTVKKTLFGRPFKGTDEIRTNLKFTESFREALVKEYGERVTQWAFPSSSYDDRMLKAKPLSGYRIQQIIARAQEAKAKDDAKLEKLLPQQAPVLLEKSLREAGIEGPQRGSEEWQRLVTQVQDEIRQSGKFQNSGRIKGTFEEEFKGVVDRVVGDLKWEARDDMLKGFGLDQREGSPPGREDVQKLGVKTTEKLGGGGFGEVWKGEYEGEECVVKLMVPGQMTRERLPGRLNEAMAMYLVSNKEEYKDYSKDVHIVPPSHYLITVVKDGQRQDDRLVEPKVLREILKDNDSTVVCLGLIMKKAPGEDVSRLMRNGQLTEESEKKQFIKGMLESIKGLNERGFVHHDLKPGNTFFDKKDDKTPGTTTLIDTGMLFKMPKDRDTEEHPQYIGGHGGTQLYMHPRAINGQKHGTETDLYAVGVMALEVDHPKAFGHLTNVIKLQNVKPEGVTRDWLVEQVEAKIKQLAPEIKELEPEMKALEAEIKKLEPGIKQLEEEIGKLRAEIEELNPDNKIPDDQKSPRLKDLEARRKELEAPLEELKAPLKELEARLNVLEDRKDLEALRKELGDPDKLSGFAMQCFEKTRESPERWNDREWSQQTYSELLEHPGLKYLQ